MRRKSKNGCDGSCGSLAEADDSNKGGGGEIVIGLRDEGFQAGVDEIKSGIGVAQPEFEVDACEVVDGLLSSVRGFWEDRL